MKFCMIILLLCLYCATPSASYFTMAKGGLMYEATVAGQKFSYDAQNKKEGQKK